MTGKGVDPCGGFPVVYPGGNFSVRLGNNGTGAVADRLEQKFFVSAANANFTYKYAVVFQDPGHTVNQQPAFRIEMFDSLGAAIPSTYYNVAAGQNINGFQNSANCPGVVYKPWTNVVVDLTTYIGQSVTIRFTTFDCSLSGHYGYAYIDGSCVAFQQTTQDTICVGSTKNLCAPPGFLSYVWSEGTINGNTNQCVNVSNPGLAGSGAGAAGLINLVLGFAFLAVFLAEVFLVVFLAEVFLAEGFLLAVFLAEVFVVVFLAAVFLVAVFLVVVVLAAVFLVDCLPAARVAFLAVFFAVVRVAFCGLLGGGRLGFRHGRGGRS